MRSPEITAYKKNRLNIFYQKRKQTQLSGQYVAANTSMTHYKYRLEHSDFFFTANVCVFNDRRLCPFYVLRRTGVTTL